MLGTVIRDTVNERNFSVPGELVKFQEYQREQHANIVILVNYLVYLLKSSVKNHVMLITLKKH